MLAHTATRAAAPGYVLLDIGPLLLALSRGADPRAGPLAPHLALHDLQRAGAACRQGQWQQMATLALAQGWSEDKARRVCRDMYVLVRDKLLSAIPGVLLSHVYSA